jgi:hypothetical protein
MTPKEKALELYWKYYNRIEHTLSEEYSEHETFLCKECALIAVDELITEGFFTDGYYNRSAFWQEVKQEINEIIETKK